MTPHKRENWRTCANCAHNYVCKFRKEDKDPSTCVNHIYDADPKRYGDLQELVDPICEWIKIIIQAMGNQLWTSIRLHLRYQYTACTHLIIFQSQSREVTNNG